MPDNAVSGHEPNAQLSTLAHELKTPLAVIVGFAELLGARNDERTRVEAAKRIMEASERLRETIDDLLAGVTADKEDLGTRLVDALAAGRRARNEGQT